MNREEGRRLTRAARGFTIRHVTRAGNGSRFTIRRQFFMSPSSRSVQSGRRRLRRVAICAVLAVVAGCSVRGYEERLNRTNDLFGYMNLLNENLRAEWGDTYGFGIRMRPPRQFELKPPPPLPTEENPAPVDDRHPNFLPGIPELPGLIGAWEGQLESADGGRVFAFLYVLGNHQRFIDQQTGEGGGAEPAEFLNDLEAALQRSVLGNVNPLPEANTGSQDNVRYQERIPRAARVEGFPVPRDFTAISFLPPADRLDEFQGIQIRLQLFEYTPHESNVQLAVLMVYPVNVRNDPVVPLRLALETLQLVETAPRPQTTGETTGGEDIF